MTLAAGLASLAQCHPSTASNRSFAIPDTVPVVTLANGTYTGVYNAQYDQDFFLGLPYSQPPIGDLRLRTPVGLNKTWEGAKSAVSFSPECVQYGVSVSGVHFTQGRFSDKLSTIGSNAPKPK